MYFRMSLTILYELNVFLINDNAGGGNTQVHNMYFINLSRSLLYFVFFEYKM